jgi:AmmeMemoRadiSam system protein A
VDPTQRKVLLHAARNAIAASLGSEPARVEAAETGPGLTQPAGAFVSLHRHGDLRGCIGTFQADHAVAQTVREMAVAAATRDPRFAPISPDELPDLEIEISVLGAPRPARAEEVTVGRHGLLVSRDWQRGVLLPQVATDHRWTAEEFLAHTCKKAGLPEGAWRDPGTRIEVFEAEVFGEDGS